MSHGVQTPTSLTPEGELELSSEQQGCFSAQTVQLRLTWSEDHASLAVGPREQSLPRAQLVSLAEQILAAAQRPDVSVDGRSTTSYQARLRWRLRAPGSPDWSTGEATFFSCDLPHEMIKNMVKNRPDLAARIPPDVYARAIGLHELATAIARGASA